MIYANVLSVSEKEYVESARAIGTSNFKIVTKYVLPNSFAPILIAITFQMASAILSESSLSFLGFGANVTEPDWGSMLSTGRNYLNTAPHMVLFPGILIFLTVLAFNLLGDGLRDTLDPKMN